MSEIENIVTELKNIHNGNAWHGPSLHEALAEVTPEQAASRPIKGAHSIWEIVSHITGWENVFRRRIAGEAIGEPDEGDFPAIHEVSDQSWANVLKRLEEEHEKFLTTIGGLSDDVLESRMPGRDYSLGFLLRSAVRHHVYHAGQISLLRKAFF
jgi:uncharacterized damage-inducible protein DinB